MCGIFGIIAPGSDPQWRQDLLIKLAKATDVRGKHATGFAWVGEDGTRVFKSPEEPNVVVRSSEFKEQVLKENPEIIIGHTRNKTKGHQSNNNNNHPIHSKSTDIALVHNGAVGNDMAWRATDEHGNNPYMYDSFDGDVDSESILRMIDTMLYIPRQEDGDIIPEIVAATPKANWVRSCSIENAINDAVYNLSGGQACALVASEDPNKVYLWRTSNPLFLAYLPDRNALVFTSTEQILKNALKDTIYDIFMNFFVETKETSGDKYRGQELHGNSLITISATLNDKNEAQFEISDAIYLDPDSSDVLGTANKRRSFEAMENTYQEK